MSVFKLKVRVSISSPKFCDLEMKQKDSIYFMGICGTAMASFAVYLKTMGFLVSGSDANVYPPMSSLLEQKDISIFTYNKNNLSKKIKLVIVGNVIQKINEEIQVLEELQIPYISLPEFLEQTLLKDTKNIVIAGTHGKSTTTSLMTQISQWTHKEAGFFIAALSSNFQTSFHVTNKEWFIIEGDEYDTAFFAKRAKFFYYNPFALILTNVEFDHGDIYKNFEEVKTTFKNLIQKMSSDNYLVACFEDETVRALASFSKAQVISYGMNKGDYQIKNRQILKNQQVFDIHYKGQKIETCSLNLFGEHNALNALATIALSHTLKWPLKKVVEALNHFKGLERRLQKIGEYNKILLYEDFAHHPTAVKASLSALKEKFPNKRLVVLFEPRSFTSRLNVFQKNYSEAFYKADVVIISKPFDTSRIEKNKRFSAKSLVKDLKEKEKIAFYGESIGSIKKQLFSLIRSNDVIVVMSNGFFGGILKQIKKTLQNQ